MNGDQMAHNLHVMFNLLLMTLAYQLIIITKQAT